MADAHPLVAVRIKDGIFVGNVTAAQDEDFLYMNKVTHIVNCAGAEVRNLFEDGGVQYLTFQWKDSQGGVCNTVMFDSMDANIERAVRFIDSGLEHGDCVLVHSFFGISRSCALVAAYLMVKYGWKVENALSFLTMAHQDMNIKPHFLRQLRTFAKRHNVDVDIFDKHVDDSRFALDNDQLMLRNTLVNGLTTDVQARNELYLQCASEVPLQEVGFKSAAKRRRRLQFIDTKQGTSVGSNVTTPVVVPKVSTHVDPFAAAGGAGKVYSATPSGMGFLGSAGVAAMHSGKIREAIVARPGTPTRRAAESPSSENPKGRQQLQLRPPPQQQTAASLGKQYPEHPPIQFCSSAVQQQQQQQQAAAPMPSQSTFSRGGYGVAPQAADHAAAISAQHQHQQQHASPYPTVVEAKRGASIQQQQQQQQQQPLTSVRSPFVLTTSSHPRNGSPLPMQRAAAGSKGPVVAASASLAASSPCAAAGSSSAYADRSDSSGNRPTALHQIQLRSELQQLHQQSMLAAAQQQQQQATVTAPQPLASVGSSSFTSVRYSSPQQIPASVGQLQQTRTSSPMARQAAQPSARIVSNSPTRQVMPQYPPSSSSSSAMVQRTSSPIARQRLGSAASLPSQPQVQPIYTTLLHASAGSSSSSSFIPHAHSTIISSQQMGVRSALAAQQMLPQPRAGSPMAAQRLVSSSSSSANGAIHGSGYGMASSSAYTTTFYSGQQQRASSPLQRPSQVVQARASSPKPMATGGGGGYSGSSMPQAVSNRSSPRPQSLAEQYLSSVRPATGVSSAASPALRRSQPVVTSARRF